MTHEIRPLAAAAALMILVAAGATGCASTRGGVASSASCAATLRFRGQMYYGSSLRTHPPYTWTARISAAHLHEIGAGVIPACRDTNLSADQDRSVPVARIDGVDPGAAIAVLPHGEVYLTQLSLTVIHGVLRSARGIRWDYSS